MYYDVFFNSMIDKYNQENLTTELPETRDLMPSPDITLKITDTSDVTVEYLVSDPLSRF
jgi:hypothetical protein